MCCLLQILNEVKHDSCQRIAVNCYRHIDALLPPMTIYHRHTNALLPPMTICHGCNMMRASFISSPPPKIQKKKIPMSNLGSHGQLQKYLTPTQHVLDTQTMNIHTTCFKSSIDIYT
jgi:hypothetical protein